MLGKRDVNYESVTAPEEEKLNIEGDHKLCISETS